MIQAHLTIMSSSSQRETFECPNCGAEVPSGARSCPECGSDERTGWSREAAEEAPDLPAGYGGEEDFNYDEYVKKEFGWDADRGKGCPPPLRQILLGFLVFLFIAVLVWIVR